MVLTTTESKGKFRCLKDGSSCRDVKSMELKTSGVFSTLENMGLKSSKGQYKKHIQPQEGPGSILSFQPQKMDRQSCVPSLSQRTGGDRQPFPLALASHGEVGQKIQRISAQARPDIPFQCKSCQCWAGGCAASSQRGSGGLALLHMGS